MPYFSVSYISLAVQRKVTLADWITSPGLQSRSYQSIGHLPRSALRKLSGIQVDTSHPLHGVVQSCTTARDSFRRLRSLKSRTTHRLNSLIPVPIRLHNAVLWLSIYLAQSMCASCCVFACVCVCVCVCVWQRERERERGMWQAIWLLSLQWVASGSVFSFGWDVSVGNGRESDPRTRAKDRSFLCRHSL